MRVIFITISNLFLADDEQFFKIHPQWFYCPGIGITALGAAISGTRFVNGHHDFWNMVILITTASILGYWWIQWLLEQING